MRLLIDSSGAGLVCGLAEEGAERVVAEVIRPVQQGEAIDAVVAELLGHCTMADIYAIVVGTGPGSFIGTRTAISFANGFAAAADVPLYAVNSLAAIAAAPIALQARTLAWPGPARGKAARVGLTDPSRDREGLARASAEPSEARSSANYAVLRDARRGQWYLWTPDGECAVHDEAGVLEALRRNGITETIIEWQPLLQTESRQVVGQAPVPVQDSEPQLAAALRAGGITVTFAPGVTPEGLLRAMASTEPATYVEPLYLRGFT